MDHVTFYKINAYISEHAEHPREYGDSWGCEVDLTDQGRPCYIAELTPITVRRFPKPEDTHGTD